MFLLKKSIKLVKHDCLVINIRPVCVLWLWSGRPQKEIIGPH